MIEVVLICLLATGKWEPPAPWEVVAVEVPNVGSQWIYTTDTQFGPYTEQTSAKIHVRRSVKAGERVDIPAWCLTPEQIVTPIEGK